MKRSAMRWLSAAGVLAMMSVAATTATAAVYPGSLVTFTKGSSSVMDLFTVTNSGKTLNVWGDGTRGEASGSNTYFINGVQLVGIRSVYLVDTSGANPTPVTVGRDNGFIKVDDSSATQKNWNEPATGTTDGYALFDAPFNGNGFPDSKGWLVIGDNASQTAAGKDPTKNLDHFGAFTWDSDLRDGNGDWQYSIGIDYLLRNGATGRGYFFVQVVPEPAFYQFASLLGLGGFGMLRLRRRAKKS